MRPGTTASAVGRLLLASGLLILLFVAYQLWGTGLVQSQSHALLRQQFTKLVHPPRHPRSAPATTTAAMIPTAPVPAPISSDPPLNAAVGNLKIPRVGLDQIIVEGVTEHQLAMGPGHYPGTALPGEPGNAAVAGHRTT